MKCKRKVFITTNEAKFIIELEKYLRNSKRYRLFFFFLLYNTRLPRITTTTPYKLIF